MPLVEAPSRAKRLVKNGDTILSTVRPNRRSFLYIKNQKGNVVVSTGFAVLRAKDGIDSRYFYYTVTDQKFTDYLTLSAKGSAYPAVDTEIIQRGNIPFHPLDIQQKISSILSVYDDLIENNTRRIKILEEMAQRIYREWFVDFRFPGYEKVHPVRYDKLSNGVKFVNSKMGKIPEGWEIKNIFDICNIRYGKTLPNNKMKKDGKYLVYGAAKVIGKYDEYNYENSMVITGCRGSVGQIKITKPKSFVTNNSFIFDIVEEQKLFLYHSLLNRGLHNYIGGTAQPQITLEGISALKLVIPEQELISEFNKIVVPVFKQINLLDDKNVNLIETRDILLPKLISGELDISDLNIKIKEEKL